MTYFRIRMNVPVFIYKRWVKFCWTFWNEKVGEVHNLENEEIFKKYNIESSILKKRVDNGESISRKWSRFFELVGSEEDLATPENWYCYSIELQLNVKDGVVLNEEQRRNFYKDFHAYINVINSDDVKYNSNDDYCYCVKDFAYFDGETLWGV